MDDHYQRLKQDYVNNNWSISIHADPTSTRRAIFHERRICIGRIGQCAATWIRPILGFCVSDAAFCQNIWTKGRTACRAVIEGLMILFAVCRYWRFNYFCCVHRSMDSHRFLMGRTISKNWPFTWGCRPYLIRDTLSPPESVSQKTSRSLLPFLQGTWVWPRHTGRQTTLRATLVAISRILCTACMQCGLMMMMIVW